MDPQRIVADLCQSVPSAIGAVLCDLDGEQIAGAEGAAPLPARALERAQSQLPQTLRDTQPERQLVLRLATADVIRWVHGLAAVAPSSGKVLAIELRYGSAEILIQTLPEDHYLVLVLARPCVTALARHHLDAAGRTLATWIA